MSATDTVGDAAARMDSIYRHQRYIYDLTRKFYLIGRDRLLDCLPSVPGSRVLEMGCGTGRNLVRLGRRLPQLDLYGLDVSSEMLATARASVDRARLGGRVHLAHAAGQSFDPTATFGIATFDAVYFSYVLSMIPDWSQAVLRALDLLAPGGILAIVDFGDQARAPAWRRVPLLAWLSLFDVHPRAEIEAGLPALADAVCHEQLLGGYAYLMILRKPLQHYAARTL